MTGVVLVTGGSGYIAGFLIRKLLDEGWTVRTTVRSEARVAELKRTYGDELDVSVADLMADTGWAEAVAGCTHVAHVASPLPAGAVRHEDELIVPARDGALRVLRAARGAGVERFVMTSSTAAVGYGRPDKTRFTEADWTDPTSPDAYPYVRSKTIAERVARDWVAREGGNMEFVTINPGAVLGPVHGADFSASIEAVKKVLEGSLPGLPNFGFPLVDVRDVADIHHRALVTPGLAGERFIAAGSFHWMADIAAVLRRELGPQARRVPTRRLPDFVVRALALFDPVVRQVKGELGRVREMDAAHARALLGWVPRPAEESIIATARSLLDLGLVKP